MAHIQCAKVINAPRFDVWNYMTAPDKIGEQLKPEVIVKWQNPGVPLAPNSEFLFLMSRYGIEQPIRFIIDRLVLGHSLNYRQVSGLFYRYSHSMRFEDHGQGETLVTDLIEYEIPFGLLGKIADDFIIRRNLKKLMEHRLENVVQHFNKSAEPEMTSQNEGSDKSSIVIKLKSKVI